MSCNHPLQAFFTGSYTENGKPDYVLGQTADKIFRVAEAERKGHHVAPGDHVKIFNGIPYLVNPIPVPCRDCVGCRLDRAKEWKNRCVLESTQYDNTWFITLTYSPAAVPMDRNGVLTLRPDDMTRFLKRLRAQKGKCRYFYCGEYGSDKKTARPHYHMILFGLDFSDLLPVGKNAFVSNELNKLWKLGIVSISRADPASIAYTCGYVLKKQKDVLFDGYPVKPYIRMSRRPAIGSSVLDKPVVKKTCKIYGGFSSSHWSSLPKTFAKKLGAADPVWLQAYKEAMAYLGAVNAQNKYAVYGTADLNHIGDTNDLFQLDNLKKMRGEKL